jgi:hypothetical protein
VFDTRVLLPEVLLIGEKILGKYALRMEDGRAFSMIVSTGDLKGAENTAAASTNLVCY